MSSETPGPPGASTHAQAVRFIASLRSDAQVSSKDGKIVLDDEHRDFLRNKGLSDADIERACTDAERPTSAASAVPVTQPVTSNDAFERASQEFESPLTNETAPVVPPPSYPRSPLALYSSSTDGSANSSQIVARIASSINQHRYDVLLQFMRTLQLLLVICGGAAAVTLGIFRVRVPLT